MSSSEITEWMAYYQLEPFGPPADFSRSANEVITHLNLNRDTKKKSQPFTSVDIYPRSYFGLREKPPVVKQSTEEMKKLLRGMHNAQRRKKR